MAAFQDGVEKITDLQPDMVLEGVVTNVAAFGAFVDIGVHQDGLVHVSVVKPGQIVKVKVLTVDVQRKRIALTMRLDDVPGTAFQATDSICLRPGKDEEEATESEQAIKGKQTTEEDNLNPLPWWQE